MGFYTEGDRIALSRFWKELRYHPDYPSTRDHAVSEWEKVMARFVYKQIKEENKPFTWLAAMEAQYPWLKEQR